MSPNNKPMIFFILLTTTLLHLTTACPSSQYNVNSACVDCAKGYWTQDPSATACVACPAVDHGTYTAPGCATLACDAGFEYVGTVCKLCGAGRYKAAQGTGPCVSHTPITSCTQFAVQGTPFSDSQCLSCPPLPSNAVQGGSGGMWGCGAGFANTGP